MKFFIQTIIMLLASASLTLAQPPAPQTLGLQQAVTEALANNLGLQLTKADKEMAQGSAQSKHASFDSYFSVQATYRDTELTPTYLGGHSREEEASWQTSITKRLTSGTELDLAWQNQRYSNDLTINTIEPAYSSALILSLNQPLLQGFGPTAQLAELRAAQKKAEAAQYEVDNQAAQLARDVTIAYWQLLFAWQEIKVKQLSLQLAKQLQAETAEKIKVGSLAQVEIYQPESEVARRQQQLIGAERAIGVAEDRLKLLLNRNDWQQAIQPTDLPPSQLPVPDFNEVVSKALARRPDLQAAKEQEAAAHLEESSARNKTLPSLNLKAGVGINGVDDDYGQAMDGIDSNEFWQLAILYRQPLGNNLARGRHGQAKANLRRASTQRAMLTLEIERQARQAVRDIRLANKAVEAGSKTSLATQKSLEAQQAKFAVGLATAYDVLVAQEAYGLALAGENASKMQLATAGAELDRIQGQISLE